MIEALIALLVIAIFYLFIEKKAPPIKQFAKKSRGKVRFAKAIRQTIQNYGDRAKEIIIMSEKNL